MRNPVIRLLLRRATPATSHSAYMGEGVIFKAMSGFYYVESAGEMVECRARGRFRLDGSVPLVGDSVEFMPTEPGRGYLTAIRPRKNSFIRPPVSNIDIMVIVASAAIPVTDTFLIDRMSATAIRNGCEPVICINKRDLDPARKLFEIYNAVGFKTLRTSAETREGVEELLEAIQGSVSAFTGNSGVGKSSILNSMSRDCHIAVGEVSEKLGRGRHTTRHVELFRMAGGAIVADTPGFSAFDSTTLRGREELERLFPEFEPYIGGCRFIDCAHIKEPGCAIIGALEEGKLQRTRYSSYARLYGIGKDYKEWEKRDVAPRQ